MGNHTDKDNDSPERHFKQSPDEVSDLDEVDEKSTLDSITDDIQHAVAHPINELQEHMDDLDSSWETESLLHDMLEGSTEEDHISNPEYCTPDEAVMYRNQLRALGPEEFCRRTIEAGAITAKRLLTAFGVRPPDFLEGHSDDAYRTLLVLAISRELSKRAKLPNYNSVDDAVELLKKSRNIIVLTGAGISTSLGIPDFRSAGTGLYSKLAHLGLNDPQEVFNIEVFKEDPTIFFSVARDILPEIKRFSPTHAFIALLQQKDKLLTNYSQNIDNIESIAGISPDKLVQCHGSFATATCIKCGHKVTGEAIFPDIKAGVLPYCPKCSGGPRRGTKNSRKRKLARDGTQKKPRRRHGDYDSASDSEYDMPSKGGIMKPDITFFGEALPDEFSRRLVDEDRNKADLVVVIGTSLKVAPVSELVPFLHPHIPQIYISREPIKHHNFDIDLLGDCDVVVAELCRRAGWDLKHDMIPDDQVIKVTKESGWESRHVFTAHRTGEEDSNSSTLVASNGTDTPKEAKVDDSSSSSSSSNGSDTPADAHATRSGRRSGRASQK